jgi:hypothetical protein
VTIKLHKLERFALGVALVTGIVGGIYGFRKLPWLQLTGLVLWATLAVLVFFGGVQALATWPRDRWRALLLLAIAMGGFWLDYEASGIGAWYRDRLFRRDLPAYERVVEGFRSGAIPLGLLSPDSLPADMRSCCYRVAGYENPGGHLLIEFWTERGFPVKHAGWLYYSGPSAEEAARARGWYSGHRVAPHWYRISD